MLTLSELNSQDFTSFQKNLKNIILARSLIGALWDYRPFHSIEHLISELSGIVKSLPCSGEYKIFGVLKASIIQTVQTVIVLNKSHNIH